MKSRGISISNNQRKQTRYWNQKVKKEMEK